MGQQETYRTEFHSQIIEESDESLMTPYQENSLDQSMASHLSVGDHLTDSEAT